MADGGDNRFHPSFRAVTVGVVPFCPCLMSIEFCITCRMFLRRPTLMSGWGMMASGVEGKAVTGPAISAGSTGGNISSFDRAVQFLGGAQHLGRQVVDQLDAHVVNLNGMPASAGTCLLKDLAHLKVTKSIEGVVGFSLRTLQRRRGKPDGLLTPEQGGRI